MSENQNVEFIEASTELQDRIGTGTISDEVVAQAQKAMDENTVDFPPMAKPHLAAMDEIMDRLKKGEIDQKQAAEELMTPIMNIKANAGSFKYEVVTGLTDTVLLFLETIEDTNNKVFEIVELLRQAVYIIFAKGITGDGGEEGAALLAGFKEACDKHQIKLT